MGRILRWIALTFLLAIFLCESSQVFADQKRLYLASPLGFYESGRNFKDTVLKPALAQLGFSVVDPWTLVDHKQIDAVEALPSEAERKAAWQKLDFEIGKQNRLEIDRADIVLWVPCNATAT